MKECIDTIDSCLRDFDALGMLAKKAETLSYESLELDFSNCSFFAANMAAPFYAVLTQYYRRGNQISVINLAPAIEEILRKNCFLKEFGLSTLPDTHQTVLPFKKFKVYAGEQFLEYLDPYMKGRGIPKMTMDLEKKFKQNLLEIFKNVEIHAGSEFGTFVCGQFYPNKHQLEFTIADAGIGIPKNVCAHLNKQMKHSDAIRWALQEGHSTREGRQTGGLGLKLIKDFIAKNKGSIKIISGLGFYEFKDGEDFYKEMTYEFPGTCVNIEINTKDTNSYALRSDLKSSDIF